MVSSKSYEKIYRANVYFNQKGGYRRGGGYVLYGIVGIPSETESGPVVLDATKNIHLKMKADSLPDLVTVAAKLHTDSHLKA